MVITFNRPFFWLHPIIAFLYLTVFSSLALGCMAYRDGWMHCWLDEWGNGWMEKWMMMIDDMHAPISD